MFRICCAFLTGFFISTNLCFGQISIENLNEADEVVIGSIDCATLTSKKVGGKYEYCLYTKKENFYCFNATSSDIDNLYRSIKKNFDVLSPDVKITLGNKVVRLSYSYFPEYDLEKELWLSAEDGGLLCSFTEKQLSSLFGR